MCEATQFSVDSNKAMLKDIERREYNNRIAKSILGLIETNPKTFYTSYAPIDTGWTKKKGSLVVKTDEGYKFV